MHVYRVVVCALALVLLFVALAALVLQSLGVYGRLPEMFYQHVENVWLHATRAERGHLERPHHCLPNGGTAIRQAFAARRCDGYSNKLTWFQTIL